MSYVVVSGYYDNVAVPTGRDMTVEIGPAEMFSIWLANTRRWTSPSVIYVINSGAAVPSGAAGNWVNLPINIGHHLDLVGTEAGVRFKLAGWSTGFVLGGMLAYAAGADYIYKKQDCLAFGPWVERLYEDLEAQGADMLVGRHGIYGVEQALMILRHGFIIDFIAQYLRMNSDAGADYVNPERKFASLMDNRFKGRMAHISFGYSRTETLLFSRLNMTDPFYLHQMSYRGRLLERLREAGFL